MKKQIKKKNVFKINWKFVSLLLGLMLIGVSVYAVNQKLSYKSSAYYGAKPLFGDSDLLECSKKCYWIIQSARRKSCVDKCEKDFRNRILTTTPKPTHTPTPTQ